MGDEALFRGLPHQNRAGVVDPDAGGGQKLAERVRNKLRLAFHDGRDKRVCRAEIDTKESQRRAPATPIFNLQYTANKNTINSLWPAWHVLRGHWGQMINRHRLADALEFGLAFLSPDRTQ